MYMYTSPMKDTSLMEDTPLMEDTLLMKDTFLMEDIPLMDLPCINTGAMYTTCTQLHIHEQYLLYMYIPCIEEDQGRTHLDTV